MDFNKKRVLAIVFLFLTVGLIFPLVFCPLNKMEVLLNNGITTCEVSFFTLFNKSHIVKGTFDFTLYSNEIYVILIIVLHILGLLMLNIRKSFPYGIVLIIISWLLVFHSNWVLIDVQSDLFNQFGHVSRQSVSSFAFLLIVPEVALVFTRGIIYYKSKKCK